MPGGGGGSKAGSLRWTSAEPRAPGADPAGTSASLPRSAARPSVPRAAIPAWPPCPRLPAASASRGVAAPSLRRCPCSTRTDRPSRLAGSRRPSVLPPAPGRPTRSAAPTRCSPSRQSAPAAARTPSGWRPSRATSPRRGRPARSHRSRKLTMALSIRRGPSGFFSRGRPAAGLPGMRSVPSCHAGAVGHVVAVEEHHEEAVVRVGDEVLLLGESTAGPAGACRAAPVGQRRARTSRPSGARRPRALRTRPSTGRRSACRSPWGRRPPARSSRPLETSGSAGAPRAGALLLGGATTPIAPAVRRTGSARRVSDWTADAARRPHRRRGASDSSSSVAPP